MSLRFESYAMHHWKSVTCDGVQHYEIFHTARAPSRLF